MFPVPCVMIWLVATFSAKLCTREFGKIHLRQPTQRIVVMFPVPCVMIWLVATFSAKLQRMRIGSRVPRPTQLKHAVIGGIWCGGGMVTFPHRAPTDED
jgi:hypothetical protein